MLRPVRLARIAAEAEGVRLRKMATRMAMRVVFAVVALVFATGVLVFIHVGAWYGIRGGLNLSQVATAVILGVFDLVVAAALGFLASRSSPSRVEVEALQVRRTAVEGIGSALSMTQMALPVLRIVSGFGRRRRRA